MKDHSNDGHAHGMPMGARERDSTLTGHVYDMPMVPRDCSDITMRPHEIPAVDISNNAGARHSVVNEITATGELQNDHSNNDVDITSANNTRHSFATRNLTVTGQTVFGKGNSVF